MGDEDDTQLLAAAGAVLAEVRESAKKKKQQNAKDRAANRKEGKRKKEDKEKDKARRRSKKSGSNTGQGAADGDVDGEAEAAGDGEQPTKQAKVQDASDLGGSSAAQASEAADSKKMMKKKKKKKEKKEKKHKLKEGSKAAEDTSTNETALAMKSASATATAEDATEQKTEEEQQQHHHQNNNKKKKKKEKQGKSGSHEQEWQPRKQKTMMQRNTGGLVHWLDHPVRVDALIKPDELLPMETLGLHPRLLAQLKVAGFSRLFPVQAVIVPDMLRSRHSAYPAGDICVSAPTGSGKTLAYVIPILQRLCTRVVPQLRAVVVLPTRQLVQQVHAVFEACSRNIHADSTVPIRVAMCAGQTALWKEQQLLQPRLDGSSAVDIVITTPGRLVDHIDRTDGFTLQHVEFLVVDEADRLLMQSYQSWLSKLHNCLFAGGRPDPTNLTPQMYALMRAACAHNFPGVHVQKMFFSATLSRDPQIIANLRLCFPRMYLATQTGQAVVCVFGGKKGVNTVIPPQLHEHSIVCSASEKPLVLLYLLSSLQMDRTLVFASSVETTTRLYTLLKLFGAVRVQQISSKQDARKSSGILKKFERGEISVLVCSDTMARGIDLANVENVICYDCPSKPKTYIHRCLGRFRRLRRMIDAKTVDRMDVRPDDFAEHMDRYELALQELAAVYNKKPTAEEDGEYEAAHVLERQLVRALNVPGAGAVLRQRREEEQEAEEGDGDGDGDDGDGEEDEKKEKGVEGKKEERKKQ
ncbi:hypothetical protein PTSG_07250 [Salpingoeca rosetta]|uniref:ATP-dependent RNA helicase n=1 Tax=Salpingoeca rosetta (strain ATCC 50818 / BSB-021) TaxID=946362 RepID=F2UEH5_SALR5|nr:uncharacterized protein PTSG_07250 [Salpingoeca rosetta]EGD75025.1 hypothetical protein PTSG_07250 [Salpingoeca rosetta]|eukprot:XP_004992669.1 hypothetical protein PTSG_07250 [Salpingoeca rosetta]